MLRLHGELEAVAGLSRLREWAREREASISSSSAAPESRARISRASARSASTSSKPSRLYLTIGGERNVAECVKFLSDRLLLTGYGSAPPVEVPEHGVYIRDVEHATLEDWHQRADPTRPTAGDPVLSRAPRSAATWRSSTSWSRRSRTRGLNALAVFTSSLRVRDERHAGGAALIDGRADVLDLDAVVRARRRAATTRRPSCFERLGVPIIQAITSGMPREAWEVSQRGLTPLDTAINVAIPEFDGRIISVPVSFKDRVGRCAGTLCAARRPHRARRRPGARASPGCGTLPRAEMRVAFVLTNSVAKASQVGNAVGLDAPGEPADAAARDAARRLRHRRTAGDRATS